MRRRGHLRVVGVEAKALATRGTDPERMAYVLDAIRRGRAAIEADGAPNVASSSVRM